MSYFPVPRGLIPGSPEYNAAMIEKARGSKIVVDGVARQVDGVPPSNDAERDAANLEKFRSTGSTVRVSGLPNI